MTTTVQALLGQHPTNPVHATELHTGSNKPWTKAFPPITNMKVHTQVIDQLRDEQGRLRYIVKADFDGPFLPEYDDDQIRFDQPAYPTNYRKWRLASEKDGHLWFHTEVSNIVLAAFAHHPNIMDAAEEKALTEETSNVTVDLGYSVKFNDHSRHLAIGEFKRGLLDFRIWQSGKLTGKQVAFSQELRA